MPTYGLYLVDLWLQTARRMPYCEVFMTFDPLATPKKAHKLTILELQLQQPLWCTMEYLSALLQLFLANLRVQTDGKTLDFQDLTTFNHLATLKTVIYQQYG